MIAGISTAPKHVSAAEFIYSYYSGSAWIYDVIVDPVNGTIYSGDTAGNIRRCALSSGCDEAGDFTAVFNVPGGYITNFGIDSANGILYVNTYLYGVYKCTLTSGCDASGDFTAATGFPGSFG